VQVRQVATDEKPRENSTTEQEPQIDARAFVGALVGFLAEAKRLPRDRAREEGIRERRQLLSRQARLLGVDLGNLQPSTEGGDG
jgi:hypothetical protein